ncbi:MAG: choice-of-anchor J domain-containing protein [Dysgonamonadaceae bacterium]|jgi:hypothetical protein|nr:choice-of-anchor J domain-containing protein [Dysgonamonadaceae bacterium]
MKKIVLFAVTALVTCSSLNAQLATKASQTRKAVQPHSLPQAAKAERIGKVKKTASARFNPNLAPVKEVLSSRKLKDGSEFRTVRLGNGMVRKQILNAGKKLQRKITTRSGKSGENAGLRASAASESLNEGFEGYDGEAWDWLPQGWTDESKAGSVSLIEDIYGDQFNFTWRTVAESDNFSPKTGQACAGVQFAFPVNTLSDRDENGDGDLDTIPYNPPIPQDEWLISPPVTVKANYVFTFDLYYDPFWARISYGEDGDMNAMHTVVEALISTDGGNTWTKKWDNREDAAQYTEEDLWYIAFSGAPWIRVSIDLAEYSNRNIQIAIRYWDDGGESVYVDNVAVGYLIPEASYRRPSGYLISGLSPDYYALNEINLIFGHAYTPTLWNGEVKNQESVSWSFSDADLAPAGLYSEQNPIVTLPYGLYETPLLTATGKGGTKAEFQLGTGGDAEFSWMGLGGQNIWYDGYGYRSFGLGNYDLQYGIAYYSDINAEDIDGYGYTFKGVANYFEKPVAKYMCETFYVHLGNIVPKPDEPVKLNIYAINEEGYMDEIVATSEAWPEDFIFAFSDDYGIDYYTIPFTFKATDPETGRERESYLEIDDHFVAEFYNYQSADMFFQYEDHPSGDEYAFVTVEEGILSLGAATSALFGMDAAFPFLHTENDRYEAPVTGGTNRFEISTYWTPDSWSWLLENGEELPDWISIGKLSLNNSTGIVTFPVTVDALPSNIPGRNADIHITSDACNLTLKITQGNATGIGAVKSEKVKVVRQGDRFALSYPAGTSSVAVYSAAGQKIAEYALNPAGTHSIPAARLPKGVYILKFAGKTGETAKAVKW